MPIYAHQPISTCTSAWFRIFFIRVPGAVFIDSGHSLETVYKVYQSFRPEYEQVIRQPPKNAKKLLHEHCHSVSFGAAEVRSVFMC
jgi:hypothetical protein